MDDVITDIYVLKLKSKRNLMNFRSMPRSRYRAEFNVSHNYYGIGIYDHNEERLDFMYVLGPNGITFEVC